jgi:uncharacterized membrane protein
MNAGFLTTCRNRANSTMIAAASSRPAARAQTRIQSIDIIRGAIMILMAIDHTRDFFHAGAFQFSPTDLSRTTAAIFLTRWVTHFCAPVFMFTAGLGAFLLGRRLSADKLSRFLWTRGVWLIFLELTAIHLAFNFNFSYRFLVLNVLWALGWSMIALAALVSLSYVAILAVSLGMIALHNLADSISAARFGPAAPAWNLIHQLGPFQIGGYTIVAAYPLIPWVGVMAAGYCCGRVFSSEPDRRRRLLVRLGLGLTLGFVALRTVNVYGDPAPWSRQSSVLYTLLSFLNCSKYPPSLDFLLMTLGPALIALGMVERVRLADANPLIVFGRTPLFYFVVHLFLIHALALLFACIRYGSGSFFLNPLPSAGGPPGVFPADYGYSLGVVYAVWIMVLIILYPLCRWFAGVKRRRKDWWLSYL